MPRSDPFSFIPINTEYESKKAYCKKCEDIAGQFNRLVPRFVNGIRDDKFKVCSYCGELYPIFDVMYFTEYEPKGYIADNPFDTGVKVAVSSQKRKSRQLRTNRPLVNEDVDIPKFAGKKDEFLERKIKEEGGIINKIVDTWTEE